jgi:hypothetical protein
MEKKLKNNFSPPSTHINAEVLLII